jgi:4-hydroxybenzoate polyprenyltransferase
MIHLLRLCRLYYAIPMSSILTLTIWYAIGDAILDQWPSTLLATISLALVISGSYALNDVCDRHVDRINSPDRPLPGGRVNPTVATLWACGLFAAGLALAALCRPQFFVVLIVVAAVAVFYDLTSKRLGIGKPILVGLLMTSFYPLAFTQAGHDATTDRVTTLYIFPIWLFLTSFGYEILKDIHDTRGDDTVGDGPTWIRRFPTLATGLSKTAVIAGALVLIGPGLTGCGWIYLCFVPVAIALAVWSAFLCHRRAMFAIYAECVVVGVAATADITILGP